MKIEFDPAKNAKNIRESGLPFTLADEFDWTTAMIVPLSVAAAKCGALIENSAPHRNPGHATNN